MKSTAVSDVAAHEGMPRSRRDAPLTRRLTRTLLSTADALLEGERLTVARGLYQRALGALDNSAQTALLARAHRGLGRTLIALGEQQAGERALQTAVQVCHMPAHMSGDAEITREYTKAHIDTASALVVAGAEVDAESHITAAREHAAVDPDLLARTDLLAVSVTNSHMPDDADRALRRLGTILQRTGPQTPSEYQRAWVHVARGRTLVTLERYDEALHDADAATRLWRYRWGTAVEQAHAARLRGVTLLRMKQAHNAWHQLASAYRTFRNRAICSATASTTVALSECLQALSRDRDAPVRTDVLDESLRFLIASLWEIRGHGRLLDDEHRRVAWHRSRVLPLIEASIETAVTLGRSALVSDLIAVARSSGVVSISHAASSLPARTAPTSNATITEAHRLRRIQASVRFARTDVPAIMMPDGRVALEEYIDTRRAERRVRYQ